MTFKTVTAISLATLLSGCCGVSFQNYSQHVDGTQDSQQLDYTAPTVVSTPIVEPKPEKKPKPVCGGDCSDAFPGDEFDQWKEAVKEWEDD